MPVTHSARIRAYSERDEKEVRFMIGQAHTEPLAYANQHMYFHPVTLAVWIAFSSVFTHYMNWWPTSEYGFLSWLKVLPPFFASAAPVMFFIDWNNRPFVESNVEKVLRRIDLLDIGAYYARSPASGLWLLEFRNKIIGMIAVDASPDAANDEPITQETSKERLRGTLERKGTSSIATIRHFFAEEAYRSAKIEDDLLAFAVESTFKANKSVSAIRVLASPLRPAILESLRRNRFSKGDRVESVGMIGWEVCWYNLERSRWEAGKQLKIDAESER